MWINDPDAVVGVVVLYNLGILSYSEKIRETAAMKVLGFQSPGIPLGKEVLDFLLDIYMVDSLKGVE